LKKGDTIATASLPWSKWQTTLKGKREKLRSFLVFLENHGRINLEETGEILRISFPKLLKYRDEYARKSGQEPDTNPVDVPLQNTETETETEENHSADAAAKKEVFDQESVPYRLAAFLLAEILKNDAQFKRPNLQSWAADFEKLVRIDKREAKEIAELIKWVQRDPFERANVLSASKLRKRYSALLLKREAEQVRGANGSPAKGVLPPVRRDALPDDMAAVAERLRGKK
jgi:Txe/YoeB family toxin of Txe-Axe toxin-antitoxin module